MVKASQVIIKESMLSPDHAIKIRESAQEIFRQASESANVAIKNVVKEVKQKGCASSKRTARVP